MKYRAISISVAVVIIVAIVVVVASQRATKIEANSPVVAVVPVEAGSLKNTIMAEGSVVPVNFVNVSMDPGLIAITQSVSVNIGDHVHKGELLAVMDPVQQEDSYEHAAAMVHESYAALATVLQPYHPEQIEAARQLENSDLALSREAESHLALVKLGTQPQLIQQAQLAVSSAQNDLDQEQANNDRLHDLLSKDLVPKVDVDTSDAKIKGLTYTLKSAQANLNLLLAQPRPDDVAQAEAAVESAKATYAKDVENLKVLEAGSLPSEIEQARAGVEANQISLEKQAEILNHRFIYAPIDGVVTARNINPGELVKPQDNRSIATAPLAENHASLFTIADASQLEFMANVDQRFYQDMREGASAQVGIESLPGRSFAAKIERKQPVINLTVPKSNSLLDPTTPLTFFAWARVDNSTHLLVPGQTGLISVDNLHPGLIVPQAAVTSFTLGKGLVYVETDGVIHLRNVQYDDSENGEYRILGGLQPGELVVVSSNLTLQDGMHVTPVESQPIATNTLAN